MGKDEENLLTIAYRQNMPVSDKIQNAPELLPGLQFYVDAFNLLSSSRMAFDGGIGHIPYSEISKFCDDMRLGDEERGDVHFLLNEVDQFYVKWQTTKIRTKREADIRAGTQKSRPPPITKRQPRR